jgi:hypothetical protein
LPDRLLLSAEVQASSSTTTTTAPPTSTAGTPAPPAATPHGPPVLSDLSQTHAVWREGGGPTSIASRRAPLGTTFLFVLNEQASVRLIFSRQLSGRQVGHRCVVQNRADASRRSCLRSLAAGGLSLAGRSGAEKVLFQGRLSSTRELEPGRYVVAVSAANAAGTSAVHTLRFTVLRR